MQAAYNMNRVIKQGIDEYPYSFSPRLVMDDISSLIESMSFINNVLLSNIYDESVLYNPQKYNQTIQQSFTMAPPTSSFKRVLDEPDQQTHVHSSDGLFIPRKLQLMCGAIDCEDIPATGDECDPNGDVCYFKNCEADSDCNRPLSV